MNRRVTRPIASRTAPLAAAVAAAVLLAACGSDDPAAAPPTTTGMRPPVVIDAVGGTGPGSPTAGADRMSADSASAEMSILPYWAGFTFEVGDGMPPLPTDAIGYQYAAGADVDEATVAALAAVLGAEGAPVRVDDPAIGVLWRVGPDDGSAPSLTVNRDAQASWYFSPAWADDVRMQPCETLVDPASGTTPVGSAAPSDPGMVGGDAAVDPAVDPSADPSAVCPVPDPEPPAGVPTADEAEARARELLDALGRDPASFTFETYADEWSAFSTAWETFAGVRTTVGWGFGFGADGALQGANGALATPVAAGPYPLVDLDAAIARLEEQQAVWGGMVRDEALIVDDAATTRAAESAAADTPVSATADSASTDAPSSGSGSSGVATTDTGTPRPVDVPVDPSVPTEPELAVLVDVRADFWWTWDADGSVWLLPAYTFTDTEGRTHTVPAVTDEYLIIVDVPATEPSVAPETIVPEPVPGGSTPPAGDPGTVEPAPIVTEPVVDPVTIDPATIVGLSLADATKVVEERGLTLRVVRRDGVDLAVTADFTETRINVAVEGDTVTDIVSLG
jgi:hypothetical protein